LAKAEDNHQIAIAEKLDLEARLNEEKQISKVSKLACFLHAHVQTNKFFCIVLQRHDDNLCFLKNVKEMKRSW